MNEHIWRSSTETAQNMNEHISHSGTQAAQNMTEDIWRNSHDPHDLLAALYPMYTLGSVRPQTRQSRMYLLACARRAGTWARLPVVCRALVALAEMCAEAPRQQEGLRAALAPIAERLWTSFGEEGDLLEAEAELSALSATGYPVPAAVLAQKKARARAAAPGEPVPPLEDDEWKGLARLVYLPFESNTPRYEWVPVELHSERLLREVYGRPYAFVPFLADWRTDNVTRIARRVYTAREFSAMPILADALQDAGCDDDDLLAHCRNGRRHVRGCWVLDQILNH
ncbi:hypothetical protein [Frigoriglobus tundricola]|uniref:Uncharacterized protein n=1 Tax=Frigoriglobus tundricola TaxID=2774151 RepID=A0A6M5YKZ0_9BACT|nr:hypothetical protein [Frigoriglobus tundricola]QJW94244.1 hypothetical protein FTUN_1764 [Frigoriglobus tundricola]